MGSVLCSLNLEENLTDGITIHINCLYKHKIKTNTHTLKNKNIEHITSLKQNKNKQILHKYIKIQNQTKTIV